MELNRTDGSQVDPVKPKVGLNCCFSQQREYTACLALRRGELRGRIGIKVICCHIAQR